MEKQKQINLGITYLQKMDICKSFVNIFKSRQIPCWYEPSPLGGIGYWAYQDEELQNKINTFEQQTGCLVYAITKNYLNFDEIYSFLFIPRKEEDIEEPINWGQNSFKVYSYVWNKTVPACSEYGDIVVQSKAGGLIRTM